MSSKARVFKAVLLSPQLTQLLGVNSLTRPQVLKSVWSYVKANNIPKNENGKYIADQKLQEVLGVPVFSPTDVLRGISKHILKEQK
mmetsp:Transcript_20736/g.21389  ORF Transcript_20736/g.21389 Transcript_20736/m.21389 type:complete len:86 (+) Transcript_20736:46-303(+)